MAAACPAAFGRTRRLPTLPVAERPLQCVQHANELLYVPHAWWHATYNLGPGTTVAVAAQEDDYIQRLPTSSALRHLITGELAMTQAIAAAHADLPEEHVSELVRAGRASFEEAVARRPRHHPSWNNLGAARLYAGEETAAIAEAFERATKLNPQYKAAWLGLGRVLLGMHLEHGEAPLYGGWRRGAAALRRAASLATSREEQAAIEQMIPSRAKTSGR
jgi:tetratricopeptide (TPR) repeat protein